MRNEIPRVGKKGELKKVAQMLTELRKTRVSEKVFEVVEESYANSQKIKQTAKSRDREA